MTTADRDSSHNNRHRDKGDGPPAAAAAAMEKETTRRRGRRGFPSGARLVAAMALLGVGTVLLDRRAVRGVGIGGGIGGVGRGDRRDDAGGGDGGGDGGSASTRRDDPGVPSSSSSSSSGAEADATPFDWDASRYVDKCLHVDNVCHSAHRFVYDRHGPSNSHNHSHNSHAPKASHQPDLLWDTKSFEAWPPNQPETVYRRYYRFRHPTPRSGDGGGDPTNRSPTITTQGCTWSPIANHLVLYGPHNGMLGEFYDRTIVYLHVLDAHNPWVRTSQLYLHLHDPYRGLMDSHHLFSEPYRSHPLRSLVDLWDPVGCECLPRLILCGYSVTKVNLDEHPDLGRYVPPRYRPGPMSGNYDHDLFDRRQPPLQQQQQQPPSQAQGNRTVLVVRPTSSYSDEAYGDGGTTYRDVRNKLRADLIGAHPHVRADASRYRAWVLDGAPPGGPKAVEPSDAVLIGLAQRMGRRRWRNLDEVRREVQAKLDERWAAGNLTERIVLVEMNLEVDSSSYQQLVRHAALDGLIGIHGAQLAEAVWMKDGSWVVELLPYIPSYAKWGQWTRTVTKPTPLGKIFVGTGLNHAGHRLPIDSSPYCGGNVSDTLCWKDKSNMWDTRDFVLSAPRLDRIVSTFFAAVPRRDEKEVEEAKAKAMSCQDWKDRAAAGDFVLYNLNCDELVGGSNVTPHSYYWPSDDVT